MRELLYGIVVAESLVAALFFVRHERVVLLDHVPTGATELDLFVGNLTDAFGGAATNQVNFDAGFLFIGSDHFAHECIFGDSTSSPFQGFGIARRSSQ